MNDDLMPKELEIMVEEGEDLQAIPGVGEAIAKKITELVATGKLRIHEELKAEFPEGITALLEIAGIGPKTAKRMSHRTGHQVCG